MKRKWLLLMVGDDESEGCNGDKRRRKRKERQVSSLYLFSLPLPASFVGTLKLEKLDVKKGGNRT